MDGWMGFGNRQASDGDSVQILSIIAAPSGERTWTLGVPASDAPVSGACRSAGRATARSTWGTAPRDRRPRIIADASNSTGAFPTPAEVPSSLLNSDVGWACRRVYLPSTHRLWLNHPPPLMFLADPKSGEQLESRLFRHSRPPRTAKTLVTRIRGRQWVGGELPMLSGSTGGGRQGSWGPR